MTYGLQTSEDLATGSTVPLKADEDGLLSALVPDETDHDSHYFRFIYRVPAE